MFASHVDRGWPMFENLDRAKMNGDALYVLIEKHECKNWMHFIQVDRRFVELFRIDDEEVATISNGNQYQILFKERRNRVTVIAVLLVFLFL